MSNTIDWARLSSEFDPADVSFRLQGNPREGKTSAVVVAYLDSRAIQQRLDDVCGPDGWSFDWQPVVTSSTAVLAAKGTITIAGVSKSDVGDAGQTEPTKASVSDALKRTAVQWGIGRYLYDLPLMFAECEKHGNTWVMARGEEERLRAKVLRGSTRPASTPVRRDTPQTTTESSSPRNDTPAPAHGHGTQATGAYNPLSDTPLRKRLTALGVRTVDDVEAFAADAQARFGRMALREACYALAAYLESPPAEDVRDAPDAADLSELPTGGIRR